MVTIKERWQNFCLNLPFAGHGQLSVQSKQGSEPSPIPEASALPTPQKGREPESQSQSHGPPDQDRDSGEWTCKAAGITQVVRTGYLSFPNTGNAESRVPREPSRQTRWATKVGVPGLMGEGPSVCPLIGDDTISTCSCVFFARSPAMMHEA